MSKDFQKIGNANLIRDLSFNFSLLLYGFPMKENKYKIYQKLNSNQKTGMLVAHLKSVAKKLGFNNVLISILTDAQYEYKLYCKRLTKLEAPTQEHIAKIFDGNVEQFLNSYESYILYKYKASNSVFKLALQTNKLLLAVINSKEANKIFKNLKDTEE